MTEEKFWLMKSEPDAYSIDTLKKDGVTLWDRRLDILLSAP